MSKLVEALTGRSDDREEARREHEHVHHHHKHHKDRHRSYSAKVVRNETPAQTVPQLEKKITTLRDHLESDLGEKDALLKLIIAGIHSLQESLDVEKNERCDDVDELHNLCNRLRQALDQEADARYGVDQSLEAFKEHSDYADLELRADIEQLQEFQRDTNEDKKIIMGAIMELEEKLNEVRATHSHQIDDLLINQGSIKKSIEEQIQIIHRIQLSDFENATMKITEIQTKLQEQIISQAEEFKELTVDASHSMERQRAEMNTIKRKIEDRIEELSNTVEKKEHGLFLKLQDTRDRFNKIEDHFKEVTTKFSAVNGAVENALDQISSTRARAEEATDIQKNRFEYFDMFMQSLKQSQSTIDSRIGFLYTIVNELRWRDRAAAATQSRKVIRVVAAEPDTVSDGEDESIVVGSTKSKASKHSKHSGSLTTFQGIEQQEFENLTAVVNEIEMEVKGKLEVLTDNLEAHRLETLSSLERARDKGLKSSSAVDKLQSVIDRMNDKFGDIARLEGDLIKINKKFDYTDRTVSHLETVSENAGKKVDVLTRKMWDMFDSDMNLNMFIDHQTKDEKERLWRLEYAHNHLKHMTIGEHVDDDMIPIHLQTSEMNGNVDIVKKNISRCLVKSEQLVDDVTNIAKQNDMIRNDMRDLKLLCDYLTSKNDETQRYCRALRKHLDFTNRKLEAVEKGKKPFSILRQDDEPDHYDFDDDLPPLREPKPHRIPLKESPMSSLKSATPIFDLFRRKEREESPAKPRVEEVEEINLKSKGASLPNSSPPCAPCGGAKSASVDPVKEPSSIATPQPLAPTKPERSFFSRIFGSDDEPALSPSPKNIGHLKSKRFAEEEEQDEEEAPALPPKPELEKKPAPLPPKHKKRSDGHINIPTSSTPVREELEKRNLARDTSHIDITRGVIANEKQRKEREMREKLRIERENALQEKEMQEAIIHRERQEKEKRRREQSQRMKDERERRLAEASEKARVARANEKVAKGELPSWDSWKDEERMRRVSYERQRMMQEENDRLKREEAIKQAQWERDDMETQEKARREAEAMERMGILEVESHRPIHVSGEVEVEAFDEASPGTVDADKRDKAATLIQAQVRGILVRRHMVMAESPEEEPEDEEEEEEEEEEGEEEEFRPPSPPSETPKEVIEEPILAPESTGSDPWSFDIEAKSQASRSSRHNSSSRSKRKKKSIFKKKGGDK